jgi:hypothetical protein
VVNRHTARPEASGSGVFHRLIAAHSETLGYGVMGCAVFCAAWYLLVDVLGLWRFRFLPPLAVVISQLFSATPRHGISLLTPEFIDAVQTNNFSKQGDNLSNTLWFDGLMARVEFRY